MSFWSEENEVQFIRLIQERPPLYDISEKTYSNRGVKTELWHEIENELDIPGNFSVSLFLVIGGF